MTEEEPAALPGHGEEAEDVREGDRGEIALQQNSDPSVRFCDASVSHRPVSSMLRPVPVVDVGEQFAQKLRRPIQLLRGVEPVDGDADRTLRMIH